MTAVNIVNTNNDEALLGSLIGPSPEPIRSQPPNDYDIRKGDALVKKLNANLNNRTSLKIKHQRKRRQTNSQQRCFIRRCDEASFR